MSLLIKALDSAEKTKQAEKNKKQEAENAATPVALELEPLTFSTTDQPAIPAPESDTQQSTAKQVPAEDLELTLSEPQKPANSLTLEEEAGLSSTPLTVNKYAKAKPAGVKAPASSAPLKNSLRETQNVTKPEPTTQLPIPATSPFKAPPTAVDANQKTAAKVFVANQAVKSPSSKYALVILGVAGALILWLGLQGYTYIQPLFAPAELAVNPVTPLPSESIAVEPVATEPVAIPATQILPTDEQVPAKDLSNSTNMEKPLADAGAATNATNAGSDNLNTNPRASTAIPTNNALVGARSAPSNTASNRVAAENASENEGVSARESLKVTSKTPSPAVDPTLLSAYQAFTRGDDGIAQQQYRLVLQKDVRNIDALLGMAAIAQRQGRHADATGWFHKVLEIEPRNSIALSSIINSQTFNDSIASESRLKSMLASQPGAAHLHAALGNIYAEQNQWTLAQEAYFNASRFAPTNADYVFNLAVSLDQLGKTNLALKQYQRALDLLNQTGAGSPDRGQLEARIQALQ
jgi:Tfp pilus assembly protein PilF